MTNPFTRALVPAAVGRNSAGRKTDPRDRPSIPVPCGPNAPKWTSAAPIALTAVAAASRRRHGAPHDAPAPDEPAVRRVALLIDTAGAYGRGLLHGIARYNREHGPWSIYCRTNGGTDARADDLLNRWGGDGIIFRTGAGTGSVELFARCGVAVVDLRSGTRAFRLPHVLVDESQVAQVAAQHLIEGGLRQFAFCGRSGAARGKRVDAELGMAFRAAIERAGFQCHQPPPTSAERRGANRERGTWEREQQRLADWVQQLPKPIGIVACDDERGLQLLDACRRCGAAVPDEVAVVGVGNDEPLCDLADPPLTSIDLNAEGVGYEAAAMLGRMMTGEPPPRGDAGTVKLAPRGVVARRSSDLAASEDEDVARAIGHIRERACRGLQVSDVLSFLGMSRASLQQRMKELIGRTIHQEIQRVRMNRAKELLTMSRLPIKQVARESGFASVQYMTRVFRAVTGETPAKYRARRAYRPMRSGPAIPPSPVDQSTLGRDDAGRA